MKRNTIENKELKKIKNYKNYLIKNKNEINTNKI